MQKIKIVVDSASDLPLSIANENDIAVAPLFTILDEEVFTEGESLTPEEVYDIVETAPQRLKTSQVTPDGFLKIFQKAKEEGYTDVIVLTLNSISSGTFQSACIAKDLFAEEGGSLNIELVDTGSYTALIAHAALKMAAMAKEGAGVSELLAFAASYFRRVEALAALGTLDHLRRMGRISGFESFVGGLLDIKPVLKVSDAQIVPLEKVKGKKKVLPRMLQLAKERMDPMCKEAIVIIGRRPADLANIVEAVKESLEVEQVHVYQIGCTLCINTGSDLFGIGYLRP